MVVATSCQLGKYKCQLINGMTGTASTCRTITQRFKLTPITAKIIAAHSKKEVLRPLSVIRIRAGSTPQIPISRISIQIPYNGLLE